MTLPVREKLNERTRVPPAARSREAASVEAEELVSVDALYVTASKPGVWVSVRTVRKPPARRFASSPSLLAERPTELVALSLVGHVNAAATAALVAVAVAVGTGVGVGVGVGVARGVTDPPPPPPPQAASTMLVEITPAKIRGSPRFESEVSKRKNGTARARAIIALT